MFGIEVWWLYDGGGNCIWLRVVVLWFFWIFFIICCVERIDKLMQDSVINRCRKINDSVCSCLC